MRHRDLILAILCILRSYTPQIACPRSPRACIPTVHTGILWLQFRTENSFQSPCTPCSTYLSFLSQWFPLRPSPQRSLTLRRRFVPRTCELWQPSSLAGCCHRDFVFSGPFFALSSFSLLGHGTFQDCCHPSLILLKWSRAVRLHSIKISISCRGNTRHRTRTIAVCCDPRLRERPSPRPPVHHLASRLEE